MKYQLLPMANNKREFLLFNNYFKTFICKERNSFYL